MLRWIECGAEGKRGLGWEARIAYDPEEDDPAEVDCDYPETTLKKIASTSWVEEGALTLEDVPADGAIGTKDLSALLASILSERRGLPGPTPRSLLALQHKPTSREVQRLVAPESTPRI